MFVSGSKYSHFTGVAERLFFRLFLLISLVVLGRTELPVSEDSEYFPDTGTTENQPLAISTFRQSRRYHRHGDRKADDDKYQDDHDDVDYHDHDDAGHMKAINHDKIDYWGGYYDFLINEGSYKFWAVFQLATAALLIYSGFAALYYAKVNPPTSDDDFDDFFRRRRRRRELAGTPARYRPYSGLDSVTFQRIIDAIERDVH